MYQELRDHNQVFSLMMCRRPQDFTVSTSSESEPSYGRPDAQKRKVKKLDQSSRFQASLSLSMTSTTPVRPPWLVTTVPRWCIAEADFTLEVAKWLGGAR